MAIVEELVVKREIGRFLVWATMGCETLFKPGRSAGFRVRGLRTFV